MNYDMLPASRLYVGVCGVLCLHKLCNTLPEVIIPEHTASFLFGVCLCITYPHPPIRSLTLATSKPV